MMAQPLGLDARMPLLLVPVHVQTRFMTGVQGGPELWVRIYPDQLSVTAHEAALTDSEASDGRAHWRAAWDGDAHAAWRLLATRYGAPRAAWIVRQLTPTNLSEAPHGAPVFFQRWSGGVRPGKIRPSPTRCPTRGRSSSCLEA